MLTSDQERKWGEFPELRKALQASPVPASYYGDSSVSDNIFSKLKRLAEVAVIVKEYQTAVAESATPQNLRQLTVDLHRLEQALEFGARFYKDHAHFCAHLADELIRQFRVAISVPAGLSYELILRHRIYSCPDSYQYQALRLITPRTAEGFMEKIFTIRRVHKADPAHLDQAQLPEDDRSRIAAYIPDARSAGILNEDGDFRFYLLDDEPAFDLPHCPRPPERLDGVHYFSVDRLTGGAPVVSPIST